jgi:hypothetical protein
MNRMGYAVLCACITLPFIKLPGYVRPPPSGPPP